MEVMLGHNYRCEFLTEIGTCQHWMKCTAPNILYWFSVNPSSESSYK
jgi:hypothetical protein